MPCSLSSAVLLGLDHTSMKILKFGGTSLGDAERISQAAGIVRRAAAEVPGKEDPWA